MKRLIITALMLFSFCSPALSQETVIDVKVKSVEANSHGITVAYKTELGEKTATLDVSRNAVITINGNSGSLEGVKPGHDAKIEYKKELMIVTKIYATGTPLVPELVRLSEIDGFYPSMANDGLTVFWEVTSNNGASIYTAKRNSTDAYFNDRTMLFPGRHPAVSGDALDLVFLAKSPNSQFDSLHITSRESVDDSFSRAKAITELASVKTPKCPFLTSDGLLLCFIRNTDEVSDVAFCVRENRQSRWSTPKPLLVVPQNMKGFVTWPAVTADRLSCFSCIEGLDAGHEGGNLVIWRRSSATEPFKEYTPVELPGFPPLKVRSPRLIESSGELIFSAHPKAIGVVGNGIIKNFPVQ